MIQSYGIAILSEDALYHLDCPEDSLDIVNQWSYHARLYHAASYVARHKEMTLIQFSSFGCGLDAITTGQVREILEQHGDIYTMIKLDEVSNLGAARIRIRSLMAAWKYGFAQIDEIEPPKQRAYFSKECQKNILSWHRKCPLNILISFNMLVKIWYENRHSANACTRRY